MKIPNCRQNLSQVLYPREEVAADFREKAVVSFPKEAQKVVKKGLLFHQVQKVRKRKVPARCLVLHQGLQVHPPAEKIYM
ncbi:hypothetical protein [Treponema sp. JC4]|uniref:hypothetical protein n=1 Tax=Treponema sp. JC4 TaxID=1124982 RepID=UPI0012DF6575|nr:hypothetical protein [Treponema sp. JC4]